MSGADRVLELRQALDTAHSLAVQIAHMYIDWENKRQPWKDEKLELRNYLFATDTSKTSNSTLPWRNKTTIPKMTQIRDNLHANYEMALFPNDDWLSWEAATEDDGLREKADAIEAYMSNKFREGEFKRIVSKCLLDYIDYGNCVATVEYVNETKEDPQTGEVIPGFIGPRAIRINPIDISIDPTATSFYRTPKIRRVIKTIGQIKKDIIDKPELGYYEDILDKALETRSRLARFDPSDLFKEVSYAVDGFTTLQDYYNSEYMEILEFEGDIYDQYTKELLRDQVVTVVDRMFVIRKQVNPVWLKRGTYVHVGWRDRPDNLWSMGPLDNLVGMQYRIDHLENLKADAMDMAVFPPLVIQGNVEEFDWGPGEEIDVGDDGNVVELGKNLNGVITASNEIVQLENRMEEMAGAPKQALGIRTPGEKTAFEVQSLQNASAQIFQHKITKFEEQFLEPLINLMFESAKRNMDTFDVVRVMDDDFGVQDFMKVTKADITATGNLRPIGARHFAARAKLIQEITQLYNSGAVGEMLRPHTSSKQLIKLLEDTLSIERFKLFKPNIGVIEQQETQRLINAAQTQLDQEDTVDTEPGEAPIG
jgi:hypothetical protein